VELDERPGGMIQITPQRRILVAAEPADRRKGIDALAVLCREKPEADPFSRLAVRIPQPRCGRDPPVGVTTGRGSGGRASG
jgi:hypothetical protein